MPRSPKEEAKYDDGGSKCRALLLILIDFLSNVSYEQAPTFPNLVNKLIEAHK